MSTSETSSSLTVGGFGTLLGLVLALCILLGAPAWATTIFAWLIVGLSAVGLLIIIVGLGIVTTVLTLNGRSKRGN
ncbi:hypothetical protein [Brevibacterium moorei]|uniref:hypothetical protein n=1 Tax=Brevibacterium moorei TaxID=2968457 RepID=UPI00211CA06D|nr:hypothetical protein [Brevibacterium sp. 68QC2CO]MCQ9385100.1 hypothetical protein [Brevibacterium sp. 68QC2CO]